MPQSADLRVQFQQVLTRMGRLVDQGVIDDPVASAYLRSMQQRLDDDKIGDAATTAQLQHLADVLDGLPDALSQRAPWKVS